MKGWKLAHVIGVAIWSVYLGIWGFYSFVWGQGAPETLVIGEFPAIFCTIAGGWIAFLMLRILIWMEVKANGKNP